MKARKNNSFVKNTITLASSNLIAQIITLLFIPVITRIYTPTEFGVFSIIISVTLPFIAVSSLRYSEAIMLAETDRESDILGYICLAICFLIGVISYIPFVVFHDLLLEVSSFKVSSNILLFIPFIVTVFGSGRVVKIWLQRKSDFKTISLSNVGASIADRAGTISIGLVFGALPVGLLTGKLLGGLTTLIVCVPSLFKCISHDLNNNNLKFVDIRRLLVRFKKFPKYSWTSIIQQSAIELPIIMFGLYFAPEVAGYYALSRRVLVEPSVIIGDAIARPFYQRTAQDNRDGKDYSVLVKRLIDYLLKLVVIPIIIFSIIAPDVFTMVFGAQWYQSGVYLQYMLPMFAMSFMMQSIGVLFNVLEKQKEWSLFVVVNFIIVSIILVVGGLIGEVSLTIILYSVVSALIILSRIIWLCKQVGILSAVILICFYKAAIISIAFTSPLILFTSVFPELKIAAILLTILSILFYYVYIVINDEYLKDHFIRLFNKFVRR